MSTVQERLQLKRVPLDTWNVREQLCLASAVVTSGDQNWMSVSRTLKTIGDPNRPADWYSQKSCAAQYGQLLEHVETPKRKKRNSEGAAGETPQESILKRLTQERIAEIEKAVEEYNQQYQTLKNELLEIKNPATSEERLKEMWAQVEATNRARERENARRAAWLREREERRARAERPWRTSSTEANVAAAPQPSSPLLTSLLKSSPVVTTPQHISHPANVVDSISPSAGAPTLSMLLEKSTTDRTPNDNKLAAIEHIKSQLVQFEQQFIQASTSAALPRSAPASLDIDDIEIKAEDVYAFRDIDLHIPTHKVQRQEKTSLLTRDDPPPLISEQPADILQSTEESIQMEHNSTTDVSGDEIVNIDTSINEPSETTEEANRQPEMSQRDVEVELKIAFPEVKFPNPEIKVIQADEIKEELIDTEPTQKEDFNVKQTPEITSEAPPSDEQNITITDMEIEEDVIPTPPVQEIPSSPQVVETAPIVVAEPLTVVENEEDIPLPVVAEEVPLAEQNPTEQPQPEQPPAPPQQEQPEEPIEQLKVDQTEQPDERTDQAQSEQNISSVLEIEDVSMAEIKQETETDAVIQDGGDSRIYDTQTETDDDTPMEFPREEDKDGKKRRDYTRKKKPESRTCSGSESAAETDSPTPDANKQHRLWKKSVMLVYSRLSAHKYASLFLRPISDEHAPGYSAVVKQPMDLSTIKKNIDNGVIRSTEEFHRAILLMLTNALMYNSTRHRVYDCAREMFKEAQNELSMLLAAQAHAGLESPPSGPRRRRQHN